MTRFLMTSEAVSSGGPESGRVYREREMKKTGRPVPEDHFTRKSP